MRLVSRPHGFLPHKKIDHHYQVKQQNSLLIVWPDTHSFSSIYPACSLWRRQPYSHRDQLFLP